jgi:Uma2 family endonuclease
MTIDTQQTRRTSSLDATPTDPIWRLEVEQYHNMIRTGILTDDDPVELLEGWLVTKMPKSPPHRITTQLTRDALAGLLPPHWYVDDQEPITTEDSEPEPDISVVRGERRQYRDRHPGAADIALVIEVSDTTLQRDRTSKKRIYARAGIAVYWIINLPEQHIEVYTRPISDAEEPNYQQREDYQIDDVVPVFLDGAEIGRLAVRDLLP